ncbi:MAG: hypothetical protein ACPGEF_02350 [Endozoicomonas sp.]
MMVVTLNIPQQAVNNPSGDSSENSKTAYFAGKPIREVINNEVQEKQRIRFGDAKVISRSIRYYNVELQWVSNPIRIAYQNGDYKSLIENSGVKSINGCGLCTDIENISLAKGILTNYKTLSVIPVLAGFGANHFMACPLSHSESGQYDAFGLEPKGFLEEFLAFQADYIGSDYRKGKDRIGFSWMNNPEAGASIPNHTHIHICDNIDVPLLGQQPTQIYSGKNFTLSNLEWFNLEVLSLKSKGEGDMKDLVKPLRKILGTILERKKRYNLMFDGQDKRILIIPRNPVPAHEKGITSKYGTLEMGGYYPVKSGEDPGRVKEVDSEQDRMWVDNYIGTLKEICLSKGTLNIDWALVLSS